MDYRLPNGATLEIASGLATAKTMSAVSNANPAVATLEAAHGSLRTTSSLWRQAGPGSMAVSSRPAPSPSTTSTSAPSTRATPTASALEAELARCAR